MSTFEDTYERGDSLGQETTPGDTTKYRNYSTHGLKSSLYGLLFNFGILMEKWILNPAEAFILCGQRQRIDV